MTDTYTPPADEKTILGHPRGLVILFFTEMWERFSYYGMRGLLVIYLTQHFLFSDQQSSIMYGAYTALVYIMTIIGGTLADRYLGARKAVTFGAILLCLGHFGMAFEGEGSRQDISFAGQSYELIAEGRGDRRKLYIDYEGAERLLVFDATTYLQLTAEDGATRTFDAEKFNAETEEVEVAAEYALNAGRRPLVENLCATVGLDFCAGQEPVTTLEIVGAATYPVENEIIFVDGEEQARRFVMIDGVKNVLQETTNTNLLITDTNATPDETGDDIVLEAIEDGAYTVGEPVKQQLYVYILYLSLALIIAGVGYLKANISTIVGSLYGIGDKRRDSGFTIFYMGINIGAFLSSLLCGTLGILYGWKYGFGLAGIGMFAGLITFLAYQNWLEGKADPPDPEKLKEKILGLISVETGCYLVGLVIIAVAMLGVMNPAIFGDIVGWLGIAMFIFLVGYAMIKLHGEERSRMFAAIYFILAQIPFWALFEQAGSSLNLFTDRLVDKTMFGWSVPAPVFQSLNAGFIFIFAPFIAWLWIALAKRKLNPPTPVKFAFGVFLAGLGFLTLVGGMNAVGPSAMTAVFFIFLIYWLHTMGELMVSPVGLSAVTKMAPARVVGMTMGAWFLYSGLSNYLAGVIARTTGAETIGGQLTNVAAAKAGYAAVYTNVGIIAIAISVVMLLISPIIIKLMAGRD